MPEYNNPDQIELRSEPVREIMGKVPSYVIRSGIGIIFFVIICLIICSYFIKYPQTISASVTIDSVDTNLKSSKYMAIIKYPVNVSGKIKLSQQVNMKFDQYPYMEFGQIIGRISKINFQPIVECSNSFYTAEIEIGNQLKTNTNHILNNQNRLTGSAEIIINTEPLIYRLLNPLKSLFSD